jgi:hypothetical protein
VAALLLCLVSRDLLWLDHPAMNKFGGIAGVNLEWRDFLGYNASCRCDPEISDRDSGQNYALCTNPGAVADRYRPYDKAEGGI